MIADGIYVYWTTAEVASVNPKKKVSSTVLSGVPHCDVFVRSQPQKIC